MIRWYFMLICILALITAAARAQTAPVGSGPYPAIIEGDPGVPGHTVYRPESLSAFNQKNPLPVVAWGNGGCANSSQMYSNFLAEIASRGFLVVAIGPFGASGGGSMQGGGTKSAQLLEALDWTTAENKRPGSKYYQKINLSKFAAFGHSCGGLQALEVSPDPRISTILVMDSGVLNTPLGAPPAGAAPAGSPQGGPSSKMLMAMPAVGKDILKRLHAPVVYIIGGEKDMAYPNAIDDFAKIDSVPVAMANLDVGHGGTYSQPNGGEFGKVAVAWLQWTLKGDETAGKMFTGPSCGLCTDKSWKYEKKRLP
jgi:hypothetical protein